MGVSFDTVAMILPVVLVVVGLCRVTAGAANFSSFCISNTTHHQSSSSGYFELNVDIPSVGTYELNTFKKFSTYSGKLIVI